MIELVHCPDMKPGSAGKPFSEIQPQMIDNEAEAATVGYPHDIKGQGIYCYVTLNAGEEGSDELYTELRNHIRTEIGPIASPDHIQFTGGLPKARSLKIMRRILRKIAENDFNALGDTSTLADPSLVQRLIEGRQDKWIGPTLYLGNKCK